MLDGREESIEELVPIEEPQSFGSRMLESREVARRSDGGRRAEGIYNCLWCLARALASRRDFGGKHLPAAGRS
jgi:hypothetical protein